MPARFLQKTLLKLSKRELVQMIYSIADKADQKIKAYESATNQAAKRSAKVSGHRAALQSIPTTRMDKGNAKNKAKSTGRLQAVTRKEIREYFFKHTS